MTANEFLGIWRRGEPSVLCHTSGSTGKPKPLWLSRRDMEISAQATNRFFGLGAGARFVCPMSFDFIGARMMAVRSEICGGELVSLIPSNSFDFEGTADLLAVVPSQVDCILDTPGMASRIRAVIIGGAPLDVARRRRIVASGLNAYTTYGMTETASHIALARVTSETAPVYRTLEGVIISTDQRGCLIADMPGRDFDHVVTNDIVCPLSSREFIWIGRADSVINSGGLKIVPEQIEAVAADVLRDLDIDFTALVVRGEQDIKWGTSAVLYVEGPTADDPSDIIKNIAMRLEDRRKAPHRVVFTCRLERTASGKIRR